MKRFLIGLVTLIWGMTVRAQTAPEIHVFLESFATNPALTQMIVFSGLPKETRKLIAWHRFPNRKDVVNLDEYNTREVELIHGEGYWPDATNRMLKATLEELEKMPTARLHLHLNMWKMDYLIRPFLEKFSKDQIAMLHLYEDGYGELFKRELYLPEKQQIYTDEELSRALKGEEKWDGLMSLFLNRFYPTTYYFFEYDTLADNPDMAPLLSYLKDLNIKSVNFKTLAQTLTEGQKQLIYRLADFDYPKYADLFRNKKTVVFLMGYHFGSKKNESRERNFLRDLRTDDNFSGIHGADYTWFYKPHPSLNAGGAVADLKEAFPDMIEITPQIPFELFALSELRPTYVAGFSSSAFYPWSKDEILYMILRGPHDGYRHFLQKIRHLDDKQFLQLSKLKDSLPQ